MSFITSTGGVNPPYTLGGVAYGTGGGASVSAAGTAGQVLTSAGAAVPTWATAASGSMTLISTVSGVGTNEINWNGLSGSYTYLIVFNGLQAGGNADQNQVRAGDNGTLVTSGYYGNGLYFNSSSATPYTDSSSGSSGVILYASGNVNRTNGYMYITQSPDTYEINFLATVGSDSGYEALIRYTKSFASIITNLQVYEPSRNWTTGSASLYKLTT